jgi:hypothetical protein
MLESDVIEQAVVAQLDFIVVPIKPKAQKNRGRHSLHA